MAVLEKRELDEAIYCDILEEWVDPTTEEGARKIVDNFVQFMEVCTDLKNIPILLNIFKVFEEIGEKEEFFANLSFVRKAIFSNRGIIPIDVRMCLFLTTFYNLRSEICGKDVKRLENIC